MGFDAMSISRLTRRDWLKQGAAALGMVGIAPSLVRAAIETPPEWEPQSDRKIRIGVVGGGFGLSFHWHEHPNCEVTAVSDLLPQRREMLQNRYGCDKAYDSLEELVHDPDLDAVAVFTPVPDHARHTILCMEHGKHVIAACPACITLEEAAQLKEVKERTGLKYMNAETSYYHPETIAMRQLVRDGVLGEILYSEGEYYHPGIGRTTDSLSWGYGMPNSDDRTWRYGFPPMLYPTHSTAFIVGVTGERLAKVSCIGTTDPDEPALKDNDYDNPFLSGMAMFETDRGHPSRMNVSWHIHAHGERAQWFGTKGALYSPTWTGQPFILSVQGQSNVTERPWFWETLPPDMRYDSGHNGSHPHISHEFVMALVEEREPAIDLYESLAFCVPGIVAHDSALQGGARLDVPCFDVT